MGKTARPLRRSSGVTPAQVFHALSDGTRRSIVERLSRRSMSVTELAGPLEVTVTAVAQHLQVLERCRLVRTEKVGRVRTCRLEPDGLQPLEQWISQCRTQWEQRLDRLGELLDAED